MNRNTTMTREDRISRFLGKKPTVNKANNEQSLDKVIQSAIAPMEERLEDMSVLLGLVVQRLEQLINIVDETPHYEQPSSFQQEGQQISFQEEDMPREMEVFDPEVSMSLTDDEDEVPQVDVTPKKRKKK